MSVLSLLLNLAWIVCGGLWMALGWLVAAVIMAITIVGIPWAKAAFNIALYTLLPFGQKAVSRADYFGQRGRRHRTVRRSGQSHMAGAGRLVAGARPSHRRGPSCGDDYWHSVCLGASQARRYRALADRQDDRAGGRGCIPPLPPVLGSRLGVSKPPCRGQRPPSEFAIMAAPSDTNFGSKEALPTVTGSGRACSGTS